VLILLGIAPHTLALSLLNPRPLIGHMHPYVIVKATPDGPATGFPTGNSPAIDIIPLPVEPKEGWRRAGGSTGSQFGKQSRLFWGVVFGVWRGYSGARMWRREDRGSSWDRVDRGSFGEWICGAFFASGLRHTYGVLVTFGTV
jgi:hypothetical protein